ncbi:uncharacterized protein DFL_003305 [Arthrobotrys flagrans]|uniref:Uncharacterized protein n=1 Tax=Arthrobotrys flagrans TaxID=97331 RepID=A0A437A1F8_ARTFL|nr:hypothetical protein DFL_003305 [Arthrobotrys flagrans]
MTTIPTISRRLPALRTARGSLAFTTATRSSASSSQTRCSYASYSSRHENDPEKLEGLKRDSLKEQKDGKGRWNEELATDSEAFVKAERLEIKATCKEIEKLHWGTRKLLKQTGLRG